MRGSRRKTTTWSSMLRSPSSDARWSAGRLRIMSRSSREVAGVDDGRQFVGRSRDRPDHCERLVPSGPLQLFRHLLQGRSCHVVVMNVRTDRLDGVEPHLVNQIEIARGERRVVRAEVIGLGPTAAVQDDEAHAV